MSWNTCGLQPPSGLRPTTPKPGSCESCSEQGLRLEIVRWLGSKASQRRLALFNEVFCYGNRLQASAVPRQSASPESAVFCYFPL
jgi:hypothetical protein